VRWGFTHLPIMLHHFTTARRMGILRQMAQGTVKSYDSITQTGFILDDTGDNLAIAKNALEGSIFITLRQGQRVNYDTIDENGFVLATHIRIGQDGY